MDIRKDQIVRCYPCTGNGKSEGGEFSCVSMCSLDTVTLKMNM